MLIFNVGRLSVSCFNQSICVVIAASLCMQSALAATHDFHFSTVFSASDVPPPADPTHITFFEQSGFAGEQVITLASGSLQEILGVFRRAMEGAPVGSPVETIFTGTGTSPTTGNAIGGFIFPQGDGVNLFSTIGSLTSTGTSITEIVQHTGVTNGLHSLVATGGQLPGGDEEVSALGLNRFAISGESFIYWAELSSGLPNERTGLFHTSLDDGSTQTLVDSQMLAPGAATPSAFVDFSFSRSGFHGSAAVFAGRFEALDNSSTGAGIYEVVPGSEPTLIFMEGAMLPGNALDSSYELGTPLIDGENILFSAFQNGPNFGTGLYGITDGQINLIVDTETPLPQNPAETFTGFAIGSRVVGGVSMDSGRVLFEANGSDGSQGVYLYDEGDLSLVTKHGDLVDGKQIIFLDITDRSLLGDSILFDIILADEVAMRPISQVMLATFTSTPGDYSGDGVVDAADYTLWRDNLGSTENLAADGDGSGIVDTADYLIWKTNFTPLVTPNATIAVPEPSAVSIYFALLLLSCLSRNWNYPG